MTFQSSRRLLAASSLGLCILLASCTNASTSSSAAIATVDGTDISRATFEKRLEASMTARQILNQMIQSVLVDNYIASRNITVADSEVDAKLNEIKARYPAGQFDTVLSQQGLTLDDVRKILRQQLGLQKAIDSNAKISESDIAAYFNKNQAQFDQAEQVHARHILVDNLKTAQQVEADLKGGMKFEDAAKKYSTDQTNKANGGDLGFFGRKQMVPEFEAAAFSQPVNVVGPPVKSPFGYHIIEVLERKPAVKATLASAHDAVKKALLAQQEQQQAPALLRDLQSKAKITIYDPQLQNALRPPGMPGPG